MPLHLTTSAAICLPCGKKFVRFLKGLSIVLGMFLFLFMLNEDLILLPLNLMELEAQDRNLYSNCTRQHLLNNLKHREVSDCRHFYRLLLIGTPVAQTCWYQEM